MAKHAERLSDVQEREWISSLGAALVGLGLVVGGGVMIYFLKFAGLSPSGLSWARVAVGLAVLVGVAILALAFQNGVLARKGACVGCVCPYCRATNQLAEAATEDYVCDHCDRTVHFAGGEPVAVLDVACKVCRAVHRIPVTATYYVCDSCNRPMRLATDGHTLSVIDAKDDAAELLANFDVVLVGYDRLRVEELAFAVQNLILLNLRDSRRAIESVSETMPLTVGMALSRRKAEAVQRDLREKGGRVLLRQSGVAAPSTRR